MRDWIVAALSVIVVALIWLVILLEFKVDSLSRALQDSILHAEKEDRVIIQYIQQKHPECKWVTTEEMRSF